ncbi:MAG: hypothetical protein GX172_06945 [Clostridiales bacterium]|nr:hypothetical protein [Clostridiales bacterium]
MKKAIAVLLSLALVFCTGIVVLADNTISSVEPPDNTASKNVTATYTPGAEPATYSVDVIWGDLQFEYKAPDKVWDPASHVYKDPENNLGEWIAAGDNTIEVKNHSSEPVVVSFAFGYAEGYGADDFTYSFGEEDSIELPAATPETTPDVKVELTLSAVSVIEEFEGPETIGTVTVTIAEPSEQ